MFMYFTGDKISGCYDCSERGWPMIYKNNFTRSQDVKYIIGTNWLNRHQRLESYNNRLLDVIIIIYTKGYNRANVLKSSVILLPLVYNIQNEWLAAVIMQDIYLQQMSLHRIRTPWGHTDSLTESTGKSAGRTRRFTQEETKVDEVVETNEGVGRRKTEGDLEGLITDKIMKRECKTTIPLRFI